MKHCGNIVLSWVALVLLASCSRVDVGEAGENKTTTPKTPPVRAVAAERAAPPDLTWLIEKEGPAVVNIVTVRTAAAALPNDPFFEFFRRFIPDLPERGGRGPRARGLGSGVIIDNGGQVLTNAHVVAGADAVTVRLADGKREFDADVVGIDRRTDIALLKIDADDLPAATIGDSSTVKAGQWVAAIGSPFGFANTITAGIVSATERDLPDESFVPFIQTDVAVNPGNSGGPLLNMRGEVIGINSMIYSGTGGYMGVSFAIPIDVAMKIAAQLEQHGEVTRGRLGVTIQPLTVELAQAFAMEQARGMVVTSVQPGSPAANADVRPGDVIVGYAGEAIDAPTSLPRRVADTQPGTETTLEVWRDGKRIELAVTIGEVPRQAPSMRPSSGPAPADSRLGIVVSELSPAQRERLGVDYGLVVERVGGPAATTQIRRGDVVVAVNGKPFSSLEEFNALIDRYERGEAIALLVRRGNGLLFVPLRVQRG